MSLVYSGVAESRAGHHGSRGSLREHGTARRVLREARPAAPGHRGQRRRSAHRHRRRAFRQLLHEQHAGVLRRHRASATKGPIEDPEWLKIRKTKVPGAPDLGTRIAREVMQTVDVAYAEEWKFDHGIMVPLNFLTPRYDLPIIPVNINCQGPPLTPLHRAWAFGEALRRACRRGAGERWRSWAPAASPIGRRRRTPERSTKTGIVSSSIG